MEGPSQQQQLTLDSPTLHTLSVNSFDTIALATVSIRSRHQGTAPPGAARPAWQQQLTLDSFTMRTMSADSLDTMALAAASTSSGAVQRPRKPGDAVSYTSLRVPMEAGGRGVVHLPPSARGAPSSGSSWLSLWQQRHLFCLLGWICGGDCTRRG